MTLRRRGVMGEREARAGAIGSRSDAVPAHPALVAGGYGCD